MVVDNAFFYPIFCGFVAFLLSSLMEFLLKPRPSFRRSFYTWLCQAAIFACLYALLLLVLGRPLCAAGAVLAFYLILILVSNAKYASLREPFLYQDYDYFLDVIRYPRLYLPFLGLKSFALCALGCLIALAAFMLEHPPLKRFALSGQGGAISLLLLFGIGSLFILSRKHLSPSYKVLKDYKKFGFITFLYLYGVNSCAKIKVTDALWPVLNSKKKKAHLIAIQSESFFDPRLLTSQVSTEILTHFDSFQRESFLQGLLTVPAWGANTIRTEFSFLTGIDLKRLGPHQFNPYRAMLKDWLPYSLPALLKDLGYDTICLHPWYAAFYGRKQLFPRMGFQCFLDLKSFADCQKSGPYVDDRCLADKLLNLLSKTQKPLFVFIISMENHGPLTKDKEGSANTSYLSSSDQLGLSELPLYLKHLKHTDLMLGKLHTAFKNFNSPISFCFYGDHVPIMPEAYQLLDYPKSETPFFCWNNFDKHTSPVCSMPVYDLAAAWLKGSKLS